MRSARWIAAVLAALAVPLLVAPGALARTSSLTGVVQLQHADARKPGAPNLWSYTLRTARRRYELRLAGPTYLTPGSYVQVRGTRRGGVFRVRSVRRVVAHTSAARRLVRAATVVASAPTQPTIAVILLNFSNDKRTPFSASTVASTLFGAGGSVANYYAEQSWNQTTLTGTVFGWVTIADTNAGCDYTTWASQALSAVHLPAGYTHVMYVFPEVDSCSWAGLGDLPGPETWINGFVQLRVMGHELGHNFGVHHASSLQCAVGATRVALSDDAHCPFVATRDEYADPFSVMGGASTRQFTAVAKEELGWLQPTGTLTVEASGTYAIAASELDGAATHLLRIPRTGGALYVDVRQPFGASFDTFTPGSAAVNGVQVRWAPMEFGFAAATQAKLVDATPGTATYNDAALTAGDSLTDPVSGAVITTDAITAGGAIVTITLPGSTDDAPTAPDGVAASVVGSDVDLTWSASTDDGTVTGYRVYRDGTQIGAPAGLAVQDTPGAGRHSYGVLAVDDQGHESAVAGPAPVSVGDATPPSEPTGLAATVTGGQVKLTWAASTDDFAVSGYRVYRGSSLLGQVTTTLAADPTGHPGVTNSYSVAAVDGAGNVSARSAMLPVKIPDTRPPSPVTGLKVKTARRPWGATLTWIASTDDVGVTGYRIYREAAHVATVTTLPYFDPNLPHGEMSVYAVAAIDAAGHEGTRARIAAVPQPDDTVAPTAPKRLKGRALTRRRVKLTWSPAFDAFGVTRYEVRAPGKVVRLTGRRVTVTVKGRRGRRVSILVYAYDDAGNRSTAARVRVKLR